MRTTAAADMGFASPGALAPYPAPAPRAIHPSRGRLPIASAVAPRPKPLKTLVREQTCLARRHSDRLLEPPLEQDDLRALQAAYRAASDDAARQAVAIAFERAVRSAPPDPRTESSAPS